MDFGQWKYDRAELQDELHTVTSTHRTSWQLLLLRWQAQGGGVSHTQLFIYVFQWVFIHN